MKQLDGEWGETIVFEYKNAQHFFFGAERVKDFNKFMEYFMNLY